MRFSLAIFLPLLATSFASPVDTGAQLEARNVDIEERGFDVDLEERGFDVDLEERGFDVDLEERDLNFVEFDGRDFEVELDDRDGDNFEHYERDFDFDFEGRDFDERNLDERDFDDAELVAREDMHSLIRRAALKGASVNAKSNVNSIRALQWLLNARGHSVIVDGNYGPKTKAAVTAFQKKAKLSADGLAGPNTLGALVSTVRSGSTGNFAKAAQAALNAFGYGLIVDGNFGDKSKAAVIKFQGSKKLNKDGVVGPNTWAALFGGGGGSTSPPTTNPTPGNCDKVTGPVPRSQTVVAAGTKFRVHKCFASRTSALVAAAKKAGINLDGWGYRSREEQIQTRIHNCNGDVWTKPASQCSPPTAIPGKSMHERGLAIDFKDVQKRSQREFVWLKNNAAKYHFYNLPSEPWHWSWNGH